MAKVTQTCGKTTIDFDERCSYVCLCQTGAPCQWTVKCPDGHGGTLDTSGTGITTNPPKHPTVTVMGTLETLAQMLEKKWKLPVFVPVSLRDKRVRKRTLTGTPEEIAHALGLQLGSRRRT